MKTTGGNRLPGCFLKLRQAEVMAATIRTRFAPSPTGYLHIGSVRTALFSWLYARRHQGSFILRIDDTDLARSTQEFVQIILDSMKWLGLDHDEGPYYQTRRYDRYHDIIQTLLDEGKAYHCRCNKDLIATMREEAIVRGDKPKYDRRCRDKQYSDGGKDTVIRFKNPLQGDVLVSDGLRGDVVYNNIELDDLIIARSDGTPTYNLVVAVDDMDMQISHVIRGDDHLNNTPRQINILYALNATPPHYTHIPLILDEQGNRLSKRYGAINVLQYREEGYLPEALLNYLIKLGWSHGDQEIFSVSDMIQYFDIKGMNKSAASINPEKLLWLNQHHLKIADDTRLADELIYYFKKLDINIQQGPNISDLVSIQKERSKTLVDIAHQSQFFYHDFDTYDIEIAKKHLKVELIKPLARIREQLSLLATWSDDMLHQIIINTAAEFAMKMGKIAQPLRVAVTGSTVSPSIDVTLRLLGKQKVLDRLDMALAYISKSS